MLLSGFKLEEEGFSIQDFPIQELPHFHMKGYFLQNYVAS